jgi:curved DNA-binding protein CbpA
MPKDYYHILQVHELAEPEVIEAAFKRLARKYHPDKDSSLGATAKMQELNEAYQVLRDPNKRADYDKGRRKSDSSQGKQYDRANEHKSKQQERQTQEQAERERVEKRRREQEAKKEQERKQEEKQKQDRERQESEKKDRKARLEKIRRRLLIGALSVISVFILVIVLIGASLYQFIYGDAAPANNAVENVANRSKVTSNTVNSPVRSVTSRTVTVPSTDMWFDTGIEIPSGSSVQIDYRGGQWTNLVGTNSVDGQGKQFDRRDLLLVPSSHLCALVAKVGNNKFHVGNSYGGTPGKGRLFLAMNDTIDRPRENYADNGGVLTVLVEIR